MPLYEYECDRCAHRFEVIHQKFSDPPITVCPTCGGSVHKLFSSPAIQFKGSGWYITDYARAGKSDASKSGAGEGGSDASASEAKGESKSESKTEAKTESTADSKKTESKTESKPAPSKPSSSSSSS
jgi:putative FmdB family regulatory protein